MHITTYFCILITQDGNITEKIIECINIKQATNLYLETFSYVNGHLPFITTGHNSAYREEGYYPDAIEVHNNDIIKFVDNEYDNDKSWTIGCAIINKFKVHSNYLINPVI